MAVPVVILHIGPLDAIQNAYPLLYFAEDDHTKPAAQEWIPLARLEDLAQTWNRQKVLTRVEEDNAVSSKFRDIGEYLASLVEIGTVGAAWKARRQKSRVDARPVRTAIHIQAEELRALPWELMFSGSMWLFRDVNTPMYRAVQSANRPPQEALPLRVLVVVGARDDEKLKIKWDTELEELRRGVKTSGAAVELEESIRPQAGDLVTLIERVRPHVFHFIGHGEMAGAPPEPALVFSGGNVRHWKASDMRQDFAQARWRPPVVLFNACRSGAARRNTTELARELIQDGTCCVIGMQGDIQGDASAAFAASLYASIVRRRSIDVAIAEARIAVRNKVDETRDWALPAVYVSCTPDDALPSTFAFPEAETVIKQFARQYKQLEDFVDRRDERRGVCWTFLGEDTQILKQSLFVLHGSPEVGKSDVVRWCTRHLFLRGRNVHYVDLEAKENSGETKAILATIRRGVKGAQGATLGALPDPPFAVFDRKFQALQDGKPEDGSEPIADLCKSFLDALKDLTKTEEWLIILDHFRFHVRDLQGTIELTDFEKDLKDAVFVPISDGLLPNLKLLLVMRDDEMKLDRGGIVGSAKIEVPAWGSDHFEWLARQFVLEALAKNRGVAEQVLALYENNRIAGAWGPTQLHEVRTAVEAIVK